MNDLALKQIEKLADFIAFEIPGEPSQSQGTIDTAIRLLKKANDFMVLLDHNLLVGLCKDHILSLHCTLWQDWLVEHDRILEDGTVVPKGLTNAAEWLAKEIESVMALTQTNGDSQNLQRL